jgi:glycosyltransferase involved in cell wall biosynthesis
MTEPTPAPVPNAAGPEVSIIIPAYGVAPYIGDTLASVMAQTATSWEAIVVNDGSPDTPALEAALEPYRNRIIYWVQPNRGAAAARNTAIRLARGTWLAFLDGDDRWLPRYLERQLDVVATRDLDLVWSNGFAIDAEGIRRGELMARSPSRGPVTVPALIQGRVHVITSATLVRRDLVEQVGGFTESLPRAQDFELWVRLVLAGARAGYHEEPLIEYRTRDGNLSGDAMSQVNRALTVMRYLDRQGLLSLEDGGVLHTKIGQLESARAVLEGKAELTARNYAGATRSFREAVRLHPSAKLRLLLALMAIAPGLARRLYLLRSPRATS